MLPLTGYVDRSSLAPGGTIAFKVSRPVRDAGIARRRFSSGGRSLARPG
jgi:hypothetical protein